MFIRYLKQANSSYKPTTKKEKRFFSETVATAEEAAGGAVVDHEGPHAVAAVG